MYSVTNRYLNYAQQNVRARCEPIIDLTVDDETHIVWTAKDITRLTFKKNADPLGRDLPVLEMEWDEIFIGKLNEQAYVDKYNNVFAYLPVKLTWRQYYDFSDDTDFEDIEYPTMYLTARPNVSGSVVEWKASGVLSFLSTTVTKRYNDGALKGAILETLLLESRAPYVNNKPLFEAISNAARAVNSFVPLYVWDEDEQYYKAGESISGSIILDGNSASLIKDFLSLDNRYVDYGNHGNLAIKKLNNFNLPNPRIRLPLSLQYEKPNITVNSNVSEYVSALHVYSDEEKFETVYPAEVTLYRAKNNPSLRCAMLRYNFGKHANVFSFSFSATSYDYDSATQYNDWTAQISFDPIKFIERVQNETNPFTNAKWDVAENMIFVLWKDSDDNWHWVTAWKDYNDLSEFGFSLPNTVFEEMKVAYNSHIVAFKITADKQFSATNYTVIPDGRSDSQTSDADIVAEEQQKPLFIRGIKIDEFIETKIISNSGSKFEENNPLNTISINGKNERISAITEYFDPTFPSIEANIAPNLSLDTGDIVEIETDLWKEDDQTGQMERVVKNGVIVGEEIEYTGSLRQRVYLHSCGLG